MATWKLELLGLETPNFVEWFNVKCLRFSCGIIDDAILLESHVRPTRSSPSACHPHRQLILTGFDHRKLSAINPPWTPCGLPFGSCVSQTYPISFDVDHMSRRSSFNLGMPQTCATASPTTKPSLNAYFHHQTGRRMQARLWTYPKKLDKTVPDGPHGIPIKNKNFSRRTHVPPLHSGIVAL
jgi:hypothetical protein